MFNMHNKITTVVDVYGRSYQLLTQSSAEPHPLAKQVMVRFQDEAKSILRKFDLNSFTWRSLLHTLHFGIHSYQARDEKYLIDILAKDLYQSRFKIFELKNIEQVTANTSNGKLYSFVRGPEIKMQANHANVYSIKTNDHIDKIMLEIDKSNEFWSKVLVKNKLQKPEQHYEARAQVYNALHSGDLLIYERRQGQKYLKSNRVEEVMDSAPVTLGPHTGKEDAITKKFTFAFSC
ncbi:hypothetical protein TDB9533_03874 [Thalassocella blandensis]|nr:hypothetical protein TDB9533_03874 [Thalassocella blandensis]